MFAIAVIVLLATAWWAYHPGLSGDFLFDDFANLPILGATGPVDNWATFWRYITSGFADPTGRPLTLLSFLIDAHDWPADPYPFKVTNVILHLINGALLAWVLWKLGKALHPSSPSRPRDERDAEAAVSPLPPGEGARRAGEGSGHALRTELDGDAAIRESGPSPLSLSRGERGSQAAPASALPGVGGSTHSRFRLDDRGVAIAALFGAGAWLLHPLLVSTTLYVVQREAMLPATFALIGMLGWMASREALARGHVKRALIGMVLSAWLCTALAVLSKANGALLPMLLLLVEWVVLSRRPMPSAGTQRRLRHAVAVFLILPALLVIAYLAYQIPGAIRGAPGIRGWTVGQRLLTEPRVLTDYLRLLFVPRAYSTGLFNDAFPVSTGWLHPASTLPCIGLVIALIGTGFALRKKHPAIALALLFYFTAQLMESGWIPLELYYEHRNYLPALLLFWPIGLALGLPGTLRVLRVLAAAIVLSVLATLTARRTTLWGDAFNQAQVWAAINPDSARAQTNAALYDLQHDRPRLAAARLRLGMLTHPRNIQLPINLIGAECKLGKVRARTLAAAQVALLHTRVGGQMTFKWFGEALDMASSRKCAGLDFTSLQGLLDAARRNPHWHGQPGLQQDLEHLQGTLDLAEAKPQQALQDFNNALAMSPGPNAALQQAAYLGSHGYPQLGLDHLDYYATLPPGQAAGFGMARIHAWVLREQGWWPGQLAYLRNNLEKDAASKATAGGSHS